MPAIICYAVVAVMYILVMAMVLIIGFSCGGNACCIGYHCGNLDSFYGGLVFIQGEDKCL